MTRPLRVALLAHEFLINIGANDFLKNIIRGLALQEQNEIIFLCPRGENRIEHQVPTAAKAALKKNPIVEAVLRAVLLQARQARAKMVKPDPGPYSFYRDACPRMRFIETDLDVESLRRLKVEHQIDVFLPSIHILPKDIPYVTYWPDCQPKHYPEFFDDESQRVRDERINGLFATGKPMIINSRDAKSDMIRFYKPNPDQIFELPFAPIIEFDRLTPHPELARPYGLTKPYFMVCNQFWVHKSIETVIEAAAVAKKRKLNIEIVFTGKMQEPRRPQYITMLREMVIEKDLGDIVRFLDYIPKNDQLELMRSAIAVIQPTLFEGGPGGGSIYDAVSLGVRAIASDIPINHELPLDPDRLVLFKKRNAKDLADKMQQMMASPNRAPSFEDLYQQSKESARKLSTRLYQAIDYAIAQGG
jgi:glycosyltransferase involved in cell wall biosynthesis